jgi:hypothetical protein
MSSKVLTCAHISVHICLFVFPNKILDGGYGYGYERAYLEGGGVVRCTHVSQSLGAVENKHVERVAWSEREK